MSDETGVLDIQKTVSARRDITVVFFVHGATYANWVPRIPLIKRDLGLTDGALGVALLGTALGVVCAVRLASCAVGRWGSRVVTRVSGLAVCASLPLIALARNLPSLMGALLLVGAALGLTDVAMNAQGVLVERRLERPVMSGLHGWYSLGGLAGGLVGAAAAHYDVAPLAHFAGAGLVLGVAVWVGSRDLLYGDGEGLQGKVTKGAWSVPVVMLGAIGLCSFVGEGAVADWSAVYLRDTLGAGDGVAGLGYAGCAVAMAVGRLSGDRLVARFGPVTVLRTGALLAALGLGAGLALHGTAAAVAGFTLFGLGMAPVAPVTFSAAGNLRGVAAASAISHVTGIGYLGFLGGPPVIGFTAEATGLAWALAIPVGLAGVIVLLAGRAGAAR